MNDSVGRVCVRVRLGKVGGVVWCGVGEGVTFPAKDCTLEVKDPQKKGNKSLFFFLQRKKAESPAGLLILGHFFLPSSKSSSIFHNGRCSHIS